MRKSPSSKENVGVRYEHDVPLFLAQSRLLQFLEVDDLLFQLVFACRNLLDGGDPTSVLSNARKMW